MKQNNRLRLVLITVSILLIIIALSFSGWITIVTFQKNYVDSLATSYQVAAQSAKRNIEYAVRYGKPLDRFNGMEQLLRYVKDTVPELENVRVIQPNGKILYDLSGPVKNQTLPADMVSEINFDPGLTGARSYTKLYAQEHHFFIPLRNKAGDWIGTLDLSVNETYIKDHVAQYSWTVIQDTVVIAIISLNFMVFLLFAVPLLDQQGNIRRTVLIAIVGCIFGLAQISYSALNIGLFQKAYISMAQSNIEVMAKSVKADVDGVIAKGIPYTKLAGLDEYLNQIIGSSPGIERIAVDTSSGEVRYQAAATRADEYLWANAVEYSQELMADKNGVTGKVQVQLSDFYIASKIKHILTDSIIIAVVFFLLVYEMFRFVPFAWRKSIQTDATSTSAISYHIRVLAYLFFLGAGMALAIMPTLSTYSEWSAALIMQLCGTAFTVSYAEKWAKKQSWHRILYAGMAIIGVGAICAAKFSGLVTILLTWGLVGSGYGLAWLAMEAYMATSELGALGLDQRTLHFWAGVVGGTLCGTAVGNLLENRGGVLSAGIAMLLLFLAAAAFVSKIKSNENLQTGIASSQLATNTRKRCICAIVPLLVGLAFVYGNLANFNIVSLSYVAALIALVTMTAAKGAKVR